MGECRLGLEAALALPRDHEIAVPVRLQPVELALGGDAPVEHHQRPRRYPERVQHAGKRPVFPDVARKHPGTPYKTTPVQHQPQGEQLAVAALLLRMPPPRLGLTRHIALVIGVGQIVERYRRRQLEQVHGAVEQMRLDRLAVCHQGIRCPVQLHRPHGLEVHTQQLPQSTALA